MATEPIRAFLGGDGLGRFVRDGFGQNNTTLVGGVILIGGLAALTGLSFLAAEWLALPAGVNHFSRRTDLAGRPILPTSHPRQQGETSHEHPYHQPPSVGARAAPIVAFGLITAACGSDESADDAPSDTTAPGGSADTSVSGSPVTSEGDDAPPEDGPTIRVRGQDFSESITIAEVYGQYLAAQGFDTEIVGAAGFRTAAIDSLENGDIDLIIDYIGGSLTELAPDAESPSDPDAIVSMIEPLYADKGATLLEYSPAVDGDALVVRGDFDGTTISDLAGTDSVFGGSAQCFERPQCFIGLTDPDIYGISFPDEVTLEFGPLLGQALTSGEVDAVIWNTTAPQIEEQGFMVLEDDQGLFPAQNIAPIIDTEVLDAYGDDLSTAINELTSIITTEDLVAWNTSTDIELMESDDVATAWMEEEGLV